MKRHPKAKGFEKDRGLHKKLLKRMLEEGVEEEDELEYEEEG